MQIYFIFLILTALNTNNVYLGITSSV